MRTRPHRLAAGRRSPALVVLAALAVVAACASGDDGDGASPGNGSSRRSRSGEGRGGAAEEATTTTTTPPRELPGGGRELFPARRVVAYYGNATTAALGVLGETSPDEAAARVRLAAAPFAQPGRPVLGAFELIVSVAQASPGRDGDYSEPTDPALIQAWLDAARENDMLLLLDVQPGRTSFVDEVKRYERFLREPDVGLALDAEWRMGPNEVPGQQIGQVSAAEVNEVSGWLALISASENLPEKLFVLHQFTLGMIPDRGAVLDRPELATVIHVDGFGSQEDKLEKYGILHAKAPFANGFKLFYDEDIDMLSPAQVLALEPTPDLITYQ